MNTPKHPKFMRQSQTVSDLSDIIYNMIDRHEIDEDLAEALIIALTHHVQLDYDALAEAYHSATPEIKHLMEKCGVVITFSEAQLQQLREYKS